MDNAKLHIKAIDNCNDCPFVSYLEMYRQYGIGGPPYKVYVYICKKRSMRIGIFETEEEPIFVPVPERCPMKGQQEINFEDTLLENKITT
jgi:hypothetical protein